MFKVPTTRTPPVPALYIATAERALRDQLHRLLTPVSRQIEVFESAPSLLAGIEQDHPGCALVDSALPHPYGTVDLLERLRRLAPDVLVLMTTTGGDVPSAVHALRAGAIDLFERPLIEAAVRQRVLDVLQTLQL